MNSIFNSTQQTGGLFQSNPILNNPITSGLTNSFNNYSNNANNIVNSGSNSISSIFNSGANFAQGVSNQPNYAGQAVGNVSSAVGNVGQAVGNTIGSFTELFNSPILLLGLGGLILILLLRK